MKLLYKKNIVKGEKVLLLSLGIITYFICYIFHNNNFLAYILIIIISSLVYTYLLNQKYLKILNYNILGGIILCVIDTMLVTIVMIMFNIDFSTTLEFNIYTILLIVFSRSIFYLSIKYLLEKRVISAYFRIDNLKTVILILIYNLFVIFLLIESYSYMQMSAIKKYTYLGITGLGMILFSGTIYSIIKRDIYLSQQEEVWRIKEEGFYKEDFYIKSMENILETIKSQRHDLNNYLSTLYGLIYLGKFDHAKKYIEEINHELNNLNVIIDTNHPIITALVSVKKNKAFDNDIDMDLDIEFPEDMEIQFIDLSIVIGNILDNAIEACQLIPVDKERKIDFKIYVEDEMLKINAKNTKQISQNIINKDITGRFTTKANNKEHGYGLGNVEFVVKQYNGNMEILNLRDEFIINVDLPIKGQKHSQAKATPFQTNP